MTHEECVDNQDDHSQVSLNGYTKGSEKDQEAFTNNNGEKQLLLKILNQKNIK